ncbi:MAG: hypothetical protein C0599_04095 [Salinivirgaceae bacterium]|nr:MAG: hypothetical protein C0599_04095 [Salinivirgaceae bacterium]
MKKMKHLAILLLFVLKLSILFAQTPNQFKYQAVLRNPDGTVMADENVIIAISILKSDLSTSVFEETHNITTNTYGLINLNIGSEEDLSVIDWSSDEYFIEISVNGTIIGTTKLLSVPYALHAKTAENIAETDPVYAAWNKNYNDLTNTPNIIDSVSAVIDTSTQFIRTEIDGSTSNEIQTISRLGTTVTLSNNGGSFIDSVNTQTLDINGTSLSISNGNTITLPENGGKVPVYTTAEILSLTPEQGDAVFNSTEKIYQIYEGGIWQSFATNCWPQPTTASAGSSQIFTNTTTSATLNANSPEIGHGNGLWSIVSGSGGNFIDNTDPATTFTGVECSSYILKWTISTDCNSSSNNVSIIFNHTPTTANAGENQIINGATTTSLAANTPENGTGEWTIISGTGGSFANALSPTTEFTGTDGSYKLRWTITTNCSSSSDDVNISFSTPLADADGNSYNTVWIGNQLWMAENLKVTQEVDGTPIPTVTDDNSSGSSNDEWDDLDYTNKAYCYYNNNAGGEADLYGALYTFAAAENACPTGWHLPTDDDWTDLVNFIISDGHPDSVGVALKDTTGWDSGGNGTDDYGFTGLPGGGRISGGVFNQAGTYGYWWSSEDSPFTANIFGLWFNYSETNIMIGNDKSSGYSVRCIKD